MENENRSGNPGNDSWVDDVLSTPKVGDEIGPDEQAIQSANLSHPDDAELEQILSEANSGAWDSEEAPSDVPAAADESQMFHDDEYRDAFGEGEELAQVFSDKPMKKRKKNTPPPEDNPDQEPPRKGRPKWKATHSLLGLPHLLATVVWCAIIVFIGVTLGRTLWVCAADVLAFGREEQLVTVTITEEDVADMELLSNKLHDAGLIGYPQLFKLYAGIAVDEGEIDAGTYTLNTVYDYFALVNHMHVTVTKEVVELMFPEGSTCADIFAKLEENGVCTAEELEQAAMTGDLGYFWFLDGMERSGKYCLEGFLFPDTYDFYTNSEPETVLRKFLNNFENKFPQEDAMEQLKNVNAILADYYSKRGFSQEYIDEHAMTFYDIVIVASMVEKESANGLEGYTISSVIYNRLSRWEVPYLNIDATIVYALNGNIDPETGKTKPLTTADTQMDHPYNTYKYMGLTPGPISNPGLNSMSAAMKPESTDYFYYALDPEIGEHRFFKDADSFNRFVATVDYS